jgi:hypothetical protein
MGTPPVDPNPFAALKFVSNQGPWSSLIFTLAFSVFIICYESTTCLARLERLQISGVRVSAS